MSLNKDVDYAQGLMRDQAAKNGESDVFGHGGKKFQAKLSGKRVYFYVDGKRVTKGEQNTAICDAILADRIVVHSELDEIDDLFGDGSQFEHAPKVKVKPCEREIIYGFYFGSKYFTYSVEVSRPKRCAALGCYERRKPGTMFCPPHRYADNRHRFIGGTHPITNEQLAYMMHRDRYQQ